MKGLFTLSISKQDMANQKNQLLRSSVEKVMIIFYQYNMKFDLHYLNRAMNIIYLTPYLFQFDDVQCFSIFIANTNKHTCTC